MGARTGLGCVMAFAVVVALAAAAGGAGGTVGAQAASGCKKNYAYSGLQEAKPRSGMRARLTSLGAPGVKVGHVAGWIGVGGAGAGPKGEDEWLQIGYSGFDDGHAEIYYEVAAPGKPPTYHTVKAKLSPTENHLISVLEVGDKKGSWRVWMDGKAVSPVISLPNSHGRFAPQAIGETWNAGTTTCNHYGYGFHDVQVATAPGGAWAAGVKGYVWTDSENTTKKVKNASFEARSVASTAPADDGPPLLGALASRLAGRPLTVRCVSQEVPVREQPAGNLLLSRTVCERLLGYALAEPAAPRADSAAGVAVVLTALGFLRGVVRADHVSVGQLDCRAVGGLRRAFRALGATTDQTLALRSALLRARAKIRPSLALPPSCPIH